MTTLLLIRHGQTDWNLEGRYQGHSDVPLNATGLQQAHQVASQLGFTRPDAIFSSDLTRTHDTAAIIGKALRLPIHLDSRLREINQGIWEGMLYEDIKREYSELVERRRNDPLSVAAPGGETVGEVRERMLAAVADIAQGYAMGSVVVVSHGLALALVKAYVASVPIDKVWQLIPRNAIVETVKIEEKDFE